MGMRRAISSVKLNANVDWLHEKAFWTFYGIFVTLLYLIFTNFAQSGFAWTYVHISHAVVSTADVLAFSPTCLHAAVHSQVTFYFMHWKKGSPVPDEDGKYDRLTFWEQVDGGSQYTYNRKVFTVIPITL